MKTNSRSSKELEFKLQQKLNNFNPEEVESYLEVLLKKCLEATIEKDYLALGTVEDILNKSIVIFSSNIQNFSLMYSNVKLKVAIQYLAKYIELDNTEAFNFFNVLPKTIEDPSEMEIETKKEMLIEVYYITEHIERNQNYLKLLLDYLYLLRKGKAGTEEGAKLESAFSHLIEVAYTKLIESYEELEKYNANTDSLTTDLVLGSNEEEKKVTSDILFYLYSIQDFKEKLEELKSNPFNDVAKFIFKDYIALIYGLEEPIEDLETFKESLTTEKEITVYNTILEGYLSTVPTYNFETFEIIPPKEIEVDPNEQEIEITKDFLEAEIEYLENLPEWLKDTFNINEEFIENKKQMLLNESSSEEDVPTNEDSSENAVPTNEG